jgi:hypothetical protein
MSTTLDLRREVKRDPITLPGLDFITEVERTSAIATWRDRMVSEHASARVFAALVQQLMRAGVARRHITAVSAMIGQELEHGLLCAKVVAALGGEAEASLPPLDEVPSHDDVSPVEAALRNVLSVSCCSETVAVALVATEREQAGPAALRAVLDRILADEVKHARFGWKLLEELAPALDPAARERLGAYLVAVFEHQIDYHAPFLKMPSASQSAVSVGVPDGPTSFQVFVDTITTVTIPGLERHGLPARRAFEAALAGAYA